ncbi:nucleotidyltransferase family protein [Endozoicomonas sp. SCSIO W0465]|uniref:nucleotidyltransferase family protein n=1 Tax=Endozoicomonas sp. SCSIO W0465 TaxID=2918516 RepID=UPI0020761487|nr:nucleotidyltransferase family protein [Endozoicomonas sp. SCSIO W0465]USE33912.1 nucleotidyltransferase family protein [Endozoicomonas sp. SCSIO W0465]
MISEAIILAGGLGTRLRSEIGDIPKPMAPISGKPFLEILIHALESEGIQHIILSLGYRAQAIIDYFQNKKFSPSLSFVVEDKILGTGGAIKLATQKMSTDYALVMNGDSFLDMDVDAASLFFDKYKAPVIFGYDVDNTHRYGRIEYEGSLITKITEKGKTGLGTISAGVYILPKRMLDRFPPDNAFSIEYDVFSTLSREDNFRLFHSQQYFIDIGTPESYKLAQVELKNHFPHLFKT